ncbi:hypothetical protein [cf. Phormidesmis sp. LEGE 11477]|uniref:hypothetical protein n=1 Tax=cf. Phormidesmis sp. LEGE 11477 TaxID=1828680 RepID=UPI0018827978|nr:hypothetical protein [cf. Phormidesmis sp. LEGE 11477]MBE9059927.1 hypothetical protein [cf. Phormidesmis sp. LEGE 11477]
MNHRFLLRLVTNLAVFLLTLACFGTVLWVIDEFLQWDILPPIWSLLVRAGLVAGGIIAFVMVVMNLLLSLALLAEASASRAQLPDYAVSARLKRRVRQSIVVVLVAIALIIGGLQITNQLRARAATQAAQVQFVQTQTEMDRSVEQVLPLFTEPILNGLANNTLTESGQISNLAKLLESVQTSFPNAPTMVIVTRADQAPFQYARIDSSRISANSQGRLTLTPQLYATFPTEQETEIIEQLFEEQLTEITGPLGGQVINTRIPSSWGVLQQDGNAITVVYLQSGSAPDFNNFGDRRYRDTYDFYHTGPERFLTN